MGGGQIWETGGAIQMAGGGGGNHPPPPQLLCKQMHWVALTDREHVAEHPRVVERRAVPAPVAELVLALADAERRPSTHHPEQVSRAGTQLALPARQSVHARARAPARPRPRRRPRQAVVRQCRGQQTEVPAGRRTLLYSMTRRCIWTAL